MMDLSRRTARRQEFEANRPDGMAIPQAKAYADLLIDSTAHLLGSWLEQSNKEIAYVRS